MGEQILLRSDNSEAVFLTSGASLVAFRVAGGDYVLSLPRLEHYADNPAYAGSLIGPVANRIRAGRFLIDGTEFELPTNEGANTLHSGRDGYHAKVWEIVEQQADMAVLALQIDESESAFPGNVEVRLTAKLYGLALQLDYAATTDAPTPMAMTQHSYFTLPGTRSVDDLTVDVQAETFTRVDSQQLPVAYFADLEESPLPQPQPANLAGIAIDHSFNIAGGGLRECVRLHGPRSSLSVLSDLPAVQLYTGEGLTSVGLPSRSGLAVEPQFPPDWINTDRQNEVILRPGETYRQTIRYEVGP